MSSEAALHVGHVFFWILCFEARRTRRMMFCMYCSVCLAVANRRAVFVFIVQIVIIHMYISPQQAIFMSKVDLLVFSMQEKTDSTIVFVVAI